MRSSPEEDDTWPTVEGLDLPSRVMADSTPVHTLGWAARSETGSVRARNEDRWCQVDSRVFVVADGMGGHAGGELAAEIVIEAMTRTRSDAWHSTVVAANLEVRTRTNAAGFERAGSTLVGLALGPDRATVISVGDSRAYRFRAGHLEQLTEDHTVRRELMAAGIDSDRHATPKQARGLTSYLGIDPGQLRVDITDVQVRAGDRLLLCSDGVHTSLDHAGLARVLTSASADEAVDGLMTAAATAGGRDNATAVVIDLG